MFKFSVGDYHEVHSEIKIYSFDSNNIRRTVEPAFPSNETFQHQFTKVTVLEEIKPGDLFEMDKLERSKQQLKQKHKGHEDKIRLSMATSSELRYLVKRSNDHPIPDRFLSSSWYWICAFSGLSLPYRWYYYCGVGHMKLKVSRKVYSQNSEFFHEPNQDVYHQTGGEISNAPIQQDSEMTAQSDSSLSEYGNYGSSSRNQHVEPIPYSSPKCLGYGPPNMDKIQSTSSTPPPGYKEACFMGDGRSQDFDNSICEYIETTV